MIYRIDIQHFISHAIDHFTAEELAHFQYAIVSAVIKNNSRVSNVVRINDLYPLAEIVMAYSECNDKSIMEKMYMDYLCPNNSNDNIMDKKSMDYLFYKTFVNPLILHTDIMIVCDMKENDYIDVICKVLQKQYLIDVIDLNKLFTEGRVGSIYIDRDAIWDKAVDIRIEAGKDQLRALESTSDGRLMILQRMMKKKDKIKKIKELGINVTENKEEDLDKILMDAWVNDEDD